MSRRYTLARDASLPAALDAVDRLLEPYGGLGAHGLEDHVKLIRSITSLGAEKL